tara:strand:+ start:311 stop:499 length:189 start_codon:yes stop_codon:yes gene_type:complete
MEDKSIIKIAEVTLTVSWEGDWDQPWTPADELWQWVDSKEYLPEVQLLKTEVKMKQLVDKDD